jgi:hypothetical protein
MGGGRPEDIDIMAQIANTMGIMPGTTICGLADGAAWPVKNAIAKFRPELEEYIRTHQSGGWKIRPIQDKIARGVAAGVDSNLVQLTASPASLADGAISRRTPDPGPA